jgi:hypothetical protein
MTPEQLNNVYNGVPVNQPRAYEHDPNLPDPPLWDVRAQFRSWQAQYGALMRRGEQVRADRVLQEAITLYGQLSREDREDVLPTRPDELLDALQALHGPDDYRTPLPNPLVNP